MNIFKKIITVLIIGLSVKAQDAEYDDVRGTHTMTLIQFQTVLRTFVDDEFAQLMDSPALRHDRTASGSVEGITLVNDDVALTDDDDIHGERIDEIKSTLETILIERISIIETDSSGRRRRTLKRNHQRWRERQSDEIPRRGRFTDANPLTVSVEVNRTWDVILSHAWAMTKLSSNRHSSAEKRNRERGSKADIETTSQISDLDVNASTVDVGGPVAEASTDEEYEFVTEWSDERDSLFLVCHTALNDTTGNEHLKRILTSAGKAIKPPDSPGAFFEVVHSSPLMACILLGMKPTYARNIAQMRDPSSASTFTIVPWVDIMKISPDLFEQILEISEEITDEESDGTLRMNESLRFHRSQERIDNSTPRHDESQSREDKTAYYVNTNSMENKNIVFSLASPTTLEDAQDVIRSLIRMSHIGRRRKTISRDRISNTFDAALHEMSISDAFTMTRAVSDAGDMSFSPTNHWSRILSSGLESDLKCVALLEDINLQVSYVKSSYEFQLAPRLSSMNTTSYTACVASIVAGLAVNPSVVNVGIVPKYVELDNSKAQWLIQGSVKDSTIWRRPFFDAGLNGNGQIVSISDTGLDTDNCYFKDDAGNGNIFNEWDLSRRKVVRYDSSPRGGDAEDVFRGHGTHVVGTLSGSHVQDGTIGDGDDAKEGMAPGARIHFFDIGLRNAVSDPRETWIESFYQDGARNGAKIASGSWGFGYRTSYDWVCKLYDQLLIDHPDVLHVSSAGNTGNVYSNPFNTIGAPASCKNVLAVGATNNFGYGSGSSYAVDFSSRGPTADGRTKPEIMAPGYSLNSAGSGFTTCDGDEPEYLKAGTSMATPVVAGAGALIRQYFQQACFDSLSCFIRFGLPATSLTTLFTTSQGFYPCGAMECGTSIDPSGTLVKAVLANGAQPLHGVQVGGSSTVLSDQDTVPYDNTQNMGVTNLLMSLPLLNENNFGILVQNDVPIHDGKTMSFHFDMNRYGCSSDFSATLAWNDPPASNGCTKCLVNDLDILIQNVKSTEKYYPNGASGPDITNNIERIRIKSAELGESYRVTVSAKNLGPGYTEQNFSLVVTGCFGQKGSDSPSVKPATSATMQTHELSTTYDADRKQAGCMFAIKAKADGVQITSFAIHTLLTGRTVKLHVYILDSPGRIYGNEPFLTNSSAWSMVSPSGGIEVDAMGFGAPTIIPPGSFSPISIEKGRIQSFYITLLQETEMLLKTSNNDYPTGEMYTSDENISIFSGVGKGIDFGRTWNSRLMNGAVFYAITSSTSKDFSLPILQPTRMPTRRPNKRPTRNNELKEFI